MARERAVVVGAGGISGAWFGPLEKERVEVVGVVELDLERARQRLAKHNLSCDVSTDLAGLLARARPDFVIDLTVPEAHCSVTCTALKAGCPVIGEKPLAATLAQARRMCRTSAETGKLYMVSQSRRWDPKHDSVRRTLSAGRLGRLTTINCDFYIGAHFGGFRDEMPSPLILDMAIHHFDLARFMTGADPVAVYARQFNPRGSWYKGDAAASCIFEMTDGIVFTYSGSWCAEGCHTSWNGDWRVIGERGTLLYDHDNDPHGEVLAGKGGFHLPKKPLKVAPSPLKHRGQHGALRELLAYLRTGRTPQCTCDDNIKSLAMVLAAIESSKKARRVEVNW